MQDSEQNAKNFHVAKFQVTSPRAQMGYYKKKIILLYVCEISIWDFYFFKDSTAWECGA